MLQEQIGTQQQPMAATSDCDDIDVAVARSLEDTTARNGEWRSLAAALAESELIAESECKAREHTARLEREAREFADVLAESKRQATMEGGRRRRDEALEIERAADESRVAAAVARSLEAEREREDLDAAAVASVMAHQLDAAAAELREAAETAEQLQVAEAVRLGLGRIVALYCHSSSSCQNR